MTAIAKRIEIHFPGDGYRQPGQHNSYRNTAALDRANRHSMATNAGRYVEYVQYSDNLEELEKIADEYLQEYGGDSLGDLDTPAFIRKASNVTIMPPCNLSMGRSRKVVEPDPKISGLFAVLKGVDVSCARACAVS